MVEDGECSSLGAEVFSDNARRLQQFNDVLIKNNYTEKGMSNELNELKSDDVNLNQLLIRALRPSMKRLY
jgi:hypothetical protein